eukprot:m.185894 g.185894  ORF g.185894 m.185894 type:complete len:327 (+) comp53549_c0_seq13:95-1075(+)
MGGVLGTGREAQLMLAARTGDTRRCNALISRSTPVNCSNQWGSTPLHHAAWQGHIETVWFLLQAGANPSARNQEGFTACDYAVKHGHGDIVTLLSKGPQYSQYSVPFVPPPNGTACVEEWQEDDEWQADDDGEWGDDYLENDIDSRLGVEQWRDSESFGQGPIVDDREAHMLVAAWNGRLADCQMFLRQGVNVHARSEDGQTCLHFAAYQGHLGVLELFLRAGADPDVQSEEGQCPLHLASWQGHTHIVHALLSFKANCNSKNKWLLTALHEAAWQGHVSAVRALLAAGADTRAKNVLGQTAGDLAVEHNRAEIVEILAATRPLSG